ncbi:hypothetical protein Tco_0521638, partial [Tanacetum coccineum]
RRSSTRVYQEAKYGNDDKEKEELKQCFEIVLDDRDDVTIDDTPLSIKIPIVDGPDKLNGSLQPIKDDSQDV